MWAGIDRCESAPPHRARSKQSAARARRLAMYTLKVLIVVAALAYSIAFEYQDLDENGAPIGHPRARGRFRIQKIERGVEPKYEKDNAIPENEKDIHYVKINVKETGGLPVTPTTTTLVTRIPSMLRKILKEGSLLPRYSINGGYIRAVKSSTTPDSYLDTDGDTSEDNYEVIDNIDSIQSWIISNPGIDDDVKEMMLRSILEEAAKAGNQQKVLVNSVWVRPEENVVEGAAYDANLIDTDDQTKKFAAKPNNGGFNNFGNDDENVTEVWVLEETNNKDFLRGIRQGSQDPQFKGFIAGEGRPMMAAFSTEKMQEAVQRTKHQHYVTNNYDSLYSLPLLIAVCVALTVAIVGFVFGWSALSRKAQAAAEVDYPAYGVTGPSVATTGDRRLAHSAHIYHYQHQKQQIIAMDSSGMESRPGSVSDPESEDNGNDGDYTVYECPGLATTGDMEVKNPMFNDEPTPGQSGLEQLKSAE